MLDPEMDDIDAAAPPPSSRLPWIIALVAALAMGAAGYLYRTNQTPAPALAPASPVEPIESAPDPGVPEPAAEAVPPPAPPVVRGDPNKAIRRLGAQASDSRELRRWLEAQGLLQRFAAATHIVAAGHSPVAPLSFIKIPGRFEAIEEGTKDERYFMGRAQFRRYDGFAKAIASIDAGACGRAYRALAPHFRAKYAEVAEPGERFDDLVTHAVHRLVRVSVPTERIELTVTGATYFYADPALEALSPAEKHILRMGPENARLVQRALKQCAAAAGLDE